MSLTVTLLGTGTSTGMPLIGCDCPACRSGDPRDRRDRPGAMVRIGEGGQQRVVLIDTPTELRHQVIGQHLRRVDAVVYTHNHADHVFGLDDLRTFNAIMRRPIDIYGEPDVIDWIRQTFRYIFEPHENVNQSWVPQLVSHAIPPARPLELAGRTWTPIR
ncbi:MAG: MBL fold metallo-hydrolase, partial [Planctomycetota bacterium]